MLSEEEKKAVEIVKKITEDDLLNYWEGPEEPYNALQVVLNLLENQQKELNNLKEIEQSHQEENGKLRIELEQEKEKHKNTGKLVKNKIDGKIGIVLREWETGQIQVLEKIQPEVINTHDSWKTLEVIKDE